MTEFDSNFSPMAQFLIMMGSEIREQRQAQKLSGVRVAADVNMHHTRLSRIERGKAIPDEVELDALIKYLGPTPEIAERIRRLYQDSMKQTFYGIPTKQTLTRTQESVWDSGNFQQFYGFGLTAIPGLLQTLPYAKAIFEGRRGPSIPHDEDDADQAVDVRLRMQRLLLDPFRDFKFLLLESALRFRLVESGQMGAQCLHLARVMTLPNVEISIVPDGAAVPVLPLSAFSIFDGARVIIDLQNGWVSDRSTTMCEFYIDTWKALSNVAMTGEGSRETVLAHAHEHLRDAAGTTSAHLTGDLVADIADRATLSQPEVRP